MPSLYFYLACTMYAACILFTGNMAFAATPTSGPVGRDGSASLDTTSISEEQLTATEQKLLQKTYANDPLPKRLQRIELSLFGATQYGTDNQRWQNIKHYLNSAHNTNNKNISSSLNELEKYIFKKTTPTQSPSQRLDKMEAKL